MNTIVFILFVCSAMAGTVFANKLTIGAALIGGVIGVIIYSSVGWPGIFIMGVFFFLATLATSWKKNFKQKLLLAQAKERRNAGQVLANGGAAGILGLLALFLPQHSLLFLFLMACAFSSATADTISSELGSVYGSKYYDILSFKKGQRGLDGVISIEGLSFGVIGSMIIAGIYSVNQAPGQQFVLIALAGTIGNLADSFLGATLERRGIIGNNAVNFLNTSTAVLTGLVLYKI